MHESVFEIDNNAILKSICGSSDRNIRKIEELSEASIIPRGSTLVIKASKERNDRLMKLLHLMADILDQKDSSYEFDDFDIRYLTRSFMSGQQLNADDFSSLKMKFPDNGKIIVPKTINQADYINSMNKNPVTIGIGPAGTGKTYLAVASAIFNLLRGKIQRIILTRPAVEAGENLGFLPGDLIQKINPYLRPLYDALFDMQSVERVAALIEKEIIEIAPLAFMRGRTLNNAFVILDEAQNTTSSQMKMFLTRLGNNSRFVISGDITQVDLDISKKSGLSHAHKVLKDVREVRFIEFAKEDISRHPVVEKIVAAYEKHEGRDS